MRETGARQSHRPYECQQGAIMDQQGANGAINAEKLQEALRAFGAPGGVSSIDLQALAQRKGSQANLPASPTPAPPAEPVAAGPQYIFVVLSEVEMAWEAARVVGVERIAEITPVPLTKPWVLGVANLRGTITSVVDLRVFLGLARQAPTARSRVIVASANGMTIGLLVDGINEIRALPPEAVTRDQLRAMTPPWLAPYADSIAIVGPRRLVVINIERLLFAEAMHQYRSES